jgi:hypothetical protein
LLHEAQLSAKTGLFRFGKRRVHVAADKGTEFLDLRIEFVLFGYYSFLMCLHGVSPISICRFGMLLFGESDTRQLYQPS